LSVTCCYKTDAEETGFVPSERHLLLEERSMEITSGRLLLRDFTPDDLAALLALEAEPALHQYRGGGQPTEEEVHALFQRTQDWQTFDQRPVYALAIALRGDGRLIGVVSLTITNQELGQAELGYRLSSRYWGQGYATEAAQGLAGFGFSSLGLHRIFAMCHPDNAGSQRVMQKAGMRYEGHLREDFCNRDGSWRDSLLYAILAQDWLALQQQAIAEGGSC
jgi:ribosomal-protein-alanine N-acetyltransferase